MENNAIITRLRGFIEAEMRNYSMDIAGITPVYVYRMWGGNFAIEDIERGLKESRMVVDKKILDELSKLVLCNT